MAGFLISLAIIVGLPSLNYLIGRFLLFRNAWYGRGRIGVRFGTWGLFLVGLTAAGLTPVVTFPLLFLGWVACVVMEVLSSAHR